VRGVRADAKFPRPPCDNNEGDENETMVLHTTSFSSSRVSINTLIEIDY